jgi:hypothetical protein
MCAINAAVRRNETAVKDDDRGDSKLQVINNGHWFLSASANLGGKAVPIATV